MGTLSELDKRYLAENLLGFFNRTTGPLLEHTCGRGGYLQIPALTNLSPRFVPSVNRSLPSRSAKYHLVAGDPAFPGGRRFNMPVNPAGLFRKPC
ncbi:MAG: hypothetical protein Ct9H300mP14_01300 [Gammaproteobacteria bacterium]|nr:MAG: hypothetical protein Ct9H300mP14_01300 [Gammaproteobacteria bacterium]